MKLLRSAVLLIAAVAVLAGCAFAAGPAKAPRDVAGYYWVYDDGTGPYASASSNADAITMLCPTWLELKGAQGEITVQQDARLVEFAKAHGIKLLPIIQSFSKRTMHQLFTNINYRSKLVRQISEALDSYGYCQGINLDFEGMGPEDRWSYDLFLLELSAKLKPKGYLVTIDVPCETHDNLKSSWSGAFDYAEIGRCCDIVMIMTYDEHESSSGPGPVASVQLDDAVLNYATSVIPKEKIYLGLPFYGYDWGEKGHTQSHRYQSTMKILQDSAAKLMWDREAKTPWYTYADANGQQRTIYFENKASIAAKLAIGRKYDVGGVCIWSLGGEDPGVWDAIREYRKR